MKSIALILGFIVTGCGSGSARTSDDNNKNNLQPLFFDVPGLVPAYQARSMPYILHLKNISDQNYELKSISVSDITSIYNSKLSIVLYKRCGAIAAKSSCNIEMTRQTRGKPVIVLLKIRLRNSDGTKKVIYHIIRMNNSINNSKEKMLFKIIVVN